MSKEAIFLSRRKAEDLLLNELHINYRLDLIKDFPRMKRKYLSENPCKFDGDFDEYYIQINNKE